jgi:hypothetical protein
MYRRNQVQVPKVVWWRRYLPDVLVALMLMKLMHPHTPMHTLLVFALLMLYLSWQFGGMLVLGASMLMLAFWGWLGGRTHVETACELIYSLIRPWLPDHSE